MAGSQQSLTGSLTTEQVMYRDTMALLASVFSSPDVIATLAPDIKPQHCHINEQGFIFSLDAIYQLIKTAQSPTYNHYRRMIFSSALNHDLAPHGLKVNSHSIDKLTNTPLYCLVTATGIENE